MISSSIPKRLLIVSLVIVAPRFALAGPPAMDVLPDTTKAFVTTADIHAFDKAWKKSRLYALVDDESMRPFWDAVEDSRGDEDAGQSVRVSWDDVLGIASGRASAATAAVRKEEPASIMLVETEGQRAAVAELMKRLEQDYKKTDAKRSEQSIANTRVIQYEFETTVDKKTQRDQRIYFVRDDVFCVATDIDLVKNVLARWSRSATDNLAGLPAYQSIVRRSTQDLPDGKARGTWFVDPFGLDQLGAQAEGADSSAHADSQRFIRQGFAGIAAVGGTVTFAEGTFDVVHHMAVYVPKPLVKTAAMLTFDPLPDTKMPGWIPADVGRAALLGWDLGAAFTAYGSWFDEVYGEGEEGIFEEVVIGIRDDPGSPGVDIRKDLLAALEGPAIVVGGSATLEASSGDPVLVAVKAKNEPQALKAVDRMLSGDPDVESRTIGSVKAWVFRDASEESEDDDESFGPDLSKVAVCVHQGYLMVATDVDLLATVLSKKPGTGPLVDSAAFQQVVEHLDQRSDKATFLRQYSDPRIDLRLLYQQLRAERIQEATSPRGRLLANAVEFLSSPAGDASADRKMPWSKLPAFDNVIPFLATGGTIGQLDADGWSIRSFTLKRDSQP